MSLKKLLPDYLLRSKISKKVRNFFNIRPSIDILDYSRKNLSVSDAFFWRVDNNFYTIFKFTRTLKLFYNILDEDINIIFFDRHNKFLKQINIGSEQISEIIIDKNFFETNEEYGVFYVFHSVSKKLNTIIRNSCYCGYSKNGNIPSMLHGNTVTAYSEISTKKMDFGIGGLSTFSNKTYTVQNNYEMDKVEIMLVNPTKNKLKITVNDLNFNLEGGNSLLLKVKDKLIKIKSKCYLLRPIVFTYKNEYLDVHHG